MTRDDTAYRRAAQAIVGSDDPAATLIRVLQIESELRKRRTRLRWLGATAAVLALGIGTWVFWNSRTAPHSAQADVYAEARWALGLLQRRPTDALDPSSEARLRRGLDSRSSRVRRASLVALVHFGRDIHVGVLERMASAYDETLDLPVNFAGSSGNEVGSALDLNRTDTVRVAARAIWVHTLRHKAYPHIDTIERLTFSRDEPTRRFAYQALGQIPAYTASAEMRLRIEEDSEMVRSDAEDLLRRE